MDVIRWCGGVSVTKQFSFDVFLRKVFFFCHFYYNRLSVCLVQLDDILIYIIPPPVKFILDNTNILRWVERDIIYASEMQYKINYIYEQREHAFHLYLISYLDHFPSFLNLNTYINYIYVFVNTIFHFNLEFCWNESFSLNFEIEN